jgi:UDP-N-acetylglucosamine--N-acetylmuramyl-(pentapeptide) pyrophosphoryl-undecaprenol N-acetylglucosamine transferase
MEIVEYMYEAPKALMAGDIIIGSAGAISIAEILYLGKPSILIPKKYTAENHQFYNAKEIEEKGAAVMILEKDLNSKILLKKVLEIINNKEKKEKMSKNSKKILNYDFKSNILKTLDELVGKDNNEK